MNMNETLGHVTKYFAGTREFGELKRAEHALRQNPKAGALVDQFRQKEQTVYTTYQGKISALKMKSLIDELGSDYEKLTAIPEIRNYFTATERFNAAVEEFMQGVNQNMRKELE